MPAVRRPSLLLSASILAALLGAPRAARAAGADLTAPAGGGQQALAVKVVGERLLAKVCAAAPCDASGGSPLALPEGFPVSGARARAVDLPLGRRVVVVEVPAKEAAAGVYTFLLAAPLAGKGTEPELLVKGTLERVVGETGEARKRVLRIDPIDERQPGKGSRVLVGEVRDDVSLCGRAALVGAMEVDPATLEMRSGALVQNLSAAERGAAPAVAARKDGAPEAPLYRLLRAESASSAIDNRVGPLTDGQATLGWAEKRAGDGRGEFATMRAPKDVPVTAVELWLAPGKAAPARPAPKAAKEKGPAPKDKPPAPKEPEPQILQAPAAVWIATDAALVRVTLPKDAGRGAAAERWVVDLPKPVHTRCLAVVLDETPGVRGEADVGLAEVVARTPLGGTPLPELAKKLEGPDGGAAAALVGAAGSPGLRAAADAYGSLGDAGKARVRDLFDAAPCHEKAPFFAARFAESVGRPSQRGAAALGERGEDPTLAQARDRLQRCGRASVEPLVGLVANAEPAARGAAARELAHLAPADAVPHLVDALAREAKAEKPEQGARKELRADLRAALATAARSDKAKAPLEAALEKRLGGLAPLARLDLLRALGASLGKLGGGPRALADALSGGDFAARYLLLPAAAELARTDAAARATLDRLIAGDPDGRVRARAAEVAARVPALAPRLVTASADPEVRVREAALGSLRVVLETERKVPAGTVAALAPRAVESWTFVRVAAFRALALVPNEAEGDKLLGKGLEDGSPAVRAATVDAIAARGSKTHLTLLRAMADEPEETNDVRARTLVALGELCDADSLGRLTDLAAKGRSPQSERDRALAQAAMIALGDLHPPDLERRLGGLLSPAAPGDMREVARAAVAAKGRCNKR